MSWSLETLLHERIVVWLRRQPLDKAGAESVVMLSPNPPPPPPPGPIMPCCCWRVRRLCWVSFPSTVHLQWSVSSKPARLWKTCSSWLRMPTWPCFRCGATAISYFRLRYQREKCLFLNQKHINYLVLFCSYIESFFKCFCKTDFSSLVVDTEANTEVYTDDGDVCTAL